MELSPFSFRLSSLILEIIERKKVSLDIALKEALKKLRTYEEAPKAYRIAIIALKRFAEADLLLKSKGMLGIPLRRKCAFRVAYSLVKEGLVEVKDIRGVRGGLLSNRLLRLFTKGELENVENLINSLPIAERLSIKFSTPKWIVETFLRFLGERETTEILKANLIRRRWIRVNTIKINIKDALKSLVERGLRPKIDKDYRFLIEVSDASIPLDNLPLIKRGHAILQDKGSVIVVESLGVKREDLILDVAAAPGIKTSLIQQVRNNEGNVIAVDISKKRVLAMKVLLKKLGVRGISIILGDATRGFFRGKFDKVLIDAPCTNSGAMRQDPALRLILWNKPGIERYHKLQHLMLINGIDMLKKGGVLVFSTCSFSEREGEAHFEQKMNDITLDPSGIKFGARGYKEFSSSEYVRRLFPHLHGTIGFFIARAIKE
ncbi:MAG: hypothetical protein DRJ41_00810 [Thermoprotei archaeon]|nr:MAG: hypothetical protein DRJ41_00810 [Thermoprotei archaeon]